MKYARVDEYINNFDGIYKDKLEDLRIFIKQLIPEAKEVISYNMPAFKLDKIIVYYAIYKNHLGFYPTANGIEEFKDELKEYKTSKGAIQFPMDKKLPYDLIKKIVLFRVKSVK